MKTNRQEIRQPAALFFIVRFAACAARELFIGGSGFGIERVAVHPDHCHKRGRDLIALAKPAERHLSSAICVRSQRSR